MELNIALQPDRTRKEKKLVLLLFWAITLMTPFMSASVGFADSQFDPLKDCLTVPAPSVCLRELADEPEGSVFWRGEKISFFAKIEAGETSATLSNPRARVQHGTEAEKSARASACFVTFAGGKDNKAYPDILAEGLNEMKINAGTYAYISAFFRLPSNCPPGDYKMFMAVDVNGEKRIFERPFKVLKATLPPVGKRSIHLDIWQHPEAIARVEGVKLWSREHLNAAKPYMKRLAEAGQKVITCSIIEEPWGHQTFDDWTSMIKWTKARDGSWKFDYTAFDTWVKFMMQEVGIRDQISCYTMIPWTMKIAYIDEASGNKQEIQLDPGNSSFEETWGAFLKDFTKHLKTRGILNKTCIALDERPDNLTKAACNVLEKYAPDLKIVSANNHPSGMSDFVYDVSPIFQHSGGDIPALAKKRTAEGRFTTFYVCCGPEKPNTFTYSPPAESHWIGLYAAANNFSGFLRWAYNSWNENPFATTSFGTWPDGDAFLVYPGNMSSVRWEAMCNGFEDYEKIVMLRSAAEKSTKASFKEAVKVLDDYLSATFTVNNGLNGSEHGAHVKRVLELINAAADNSL